MDLKVKNTKLKKQANFKSNTLSDISRESFNQLDVNLAISRENNPFKNYQTADACRENSIFKELQVADICRENGRALMSKPTQISIHREEYSRAPLASATGFYLA